MTLPRPFTFMLVVLDAIGVFRVAGCRASAVKWIGSMEKNGDVRLLMIIWYEANIQTREFKD